MHRIIRAKALNDYRLELAFSDGTQGVVDVSDLTGSGVFSLWDDFDQFLKVKIGKTGELIWSAQVDLCPDALYLRLTSKKPEEIYPSLKRDPADA